MSACLLAPLLAGRAWLSVSAWLPSPALLPVSACLLLPSCLLPPALPESLTPPPLPGSSPELVSRAVSNELRVAATDSTGLGGECGGKSRADAARGRVVAELGLAVAGRVCRAVAGLVGNSSGRVGRAVAGPVARAIPADPVHPRHPHGQCVGDDRGGRGEELARTRQKVLKRKSNVCV